MTPEEQIRQLQRELAEFKTAHAKLSLRVEGYAKRDRETFSGRLVEEMGKLGVSPQMARDAFDLHVATKKPGFGFGLDNTGEIDVTETFVDGKRAMTVAEFAKLLIAQRPHFRDSQPQGSQAQGSTGDTYAIPKTRAERVARSKAFLGDRKMSELNENELAYLTCLADEDASDDSASSARSRAWP